MNQTKPKEYCELNYHDQKIRRTLAHDIRKYWTAVSTLLGLINSEIIRSKQLSSVTVCHAQVFDGFSGRGNSIPNIIPLHKKRKYTTKVIHPVLYINHYTSKHFQQKKNLNLRMFDIWNDNTKNKTCKYRNCLLFGPHVNKYNSNQVFDNLRTVIRWIFPTGLLEIKWLTWVRYFTWIRRFIFTGIQCQIAIYFQQKVV